MNSVWDWSATKPPMVEEEIGYLSEADCQVYRVISRGRQPAKGAVLLCNHWGRDYDYTLVSWNRWARYLARHGLLVMRFDYPGVGESTGDFAWMDFERWIQAAEDCGRLLCEQAGGLPLVLHGLGTGALVAGRAFERGLGAGLLMWSPPASAREVLVAWLRHQVAGEFALPKGARRTSRQACEAAWAAGQNVDIEGFSWSPKLWAQSETLVPPKLQEKDPRPMRMEVMDDRCGTFSFATVANPIRHAAMGDLCPKTPGLFARNLNWILSSMRTEGGQHA